MASEQIFTNAKIVLPDRIIEGNVVIDDGMIAQLDEGSSSKGEDFTGDYLIAGLVELHTDHLEAHYLPRPGVRWNMQAALLAHDAQIATSGITTVFDCLRIGMQYDDFEPGEVRTMADAILTMQTEDKLRSEHFLHLRCEVSSSQALAEFATFDDHEDVRLVSLMDHAPGQRQFQSIDQYELYFKTKKGLNDEEFERFVRHRISESQKFSQPQRREIAEKCWTRGISLASHDDATIEHVHEAVRDHVRIAEFPTSVEAAAASIENGMSVLMGAPNVVRGRSHSGNVSARELAAAGHLQILSSDYVPSSMLHAPFVLAEEVDSISLPQALTLVTDEPAKAVGLDDRGRIEVGRRADFIRVCRDQGPPVVRAVWREGKRVA
ncbi:MAG: alpha-D-ribose 1-methylphosphonate 5-triphosphate diphosphatase [Pseudomonadota bacterium]